MHVSFIANPTDGRGRTRALVEAYARALPGRSDLLWTQGPSHARDLAREAVARSDAVCVVGGDGTVSEVVNGLMPQPVPMVVVPTGSGNDFASLVDCPRSPDDLARILDDGVGVRLDVIDCGDRYCANSVGIGFEAMVTYHSLTIRRLRGLPLYLLAVFKALASYESIRYTITIDAGAPLSGEFLRVSAGNGVRAGGGFYLNPGARPDDGLIDLCTVRRMSRARMLTILPAAIRGAHVGRRGIDVHRGATMTIAAERPFPMHIDGEYLGRVAGPFTMKVVGRCLPVLCRRGGTAWRHGELERLLPGAGGSG